MINFGGELFSFNTSGFSFGGQQLPSNYMMNSDAKKNVGSIVNSLGYQPSPQRYPDNKHKELLKSKTLAQGQFKTVLTSTDQQKVLPSSQTLFSRQNSNLPQQSPAKPSSPQPKTLSKPSYENATTTPNLSTQISSNAQSQLEQPTIQKDTPVRRKVKPNPIYEEWKRQNELQKKLQNAPKQPSEDFGLSRIIDVVDQQPMSDIPILLMIGQEKQIIKEKQISIELPTLPDDAHYVIQIPVFETSFRENLQE